MPARLREQVESLGEQLVRAPARLSVVRDRDDHELVADGCDDPALLEWVAPLISLYCLVGWDTGGVPWDPAG